MPDFRDEVLKLLSDIHAREVAYHNHKETSAWAGAALYAVLVASTVQVFHSAHPPDPSFRWWYTGYVVVLANVAAGYLFHQFRLRRRASAYVAAADLVRMEIVSSPSSQRTSWICSGA